MFTKLNLKPTLLYLVPIIVAVALLVATLIDRSLMGTFFIRSALYADLAMVGFFIAFSIPRFQRLTRESVLSAIKENWPGLTIALVITTAVILAVAPGFRVLSDETNLLGVSKNLYFQRNASLTINAKWYYDNLWPITTVIERRPTLFPFFVMILHTFRGFRVDNAFLVNAAVIPLFIFITYRFAKSLVGETFGIAAAFLVIAHPITLMSARAAGFDVIAAFFSVLVLKSFYEHSRNPNEETLSFLWLYLCMMTHMRYEGMLTHALATGALIALRLVKWSYIKPRLLFYSVTPLILLPRFWQAVVKAKDQEQPLSTSLFTISYMKKNLSEYLALAKTPFHISEPHNPLIIFLGLLGFVLAIIAVVQLLRKWKENIQLLKFTAFFVTWFAMSLTISFSYEWGRSLHPAAGRLFVLVDALFSLSAAFFITVVLKSYPRWIVALCTGTFIFLAIPVAAEARFINQLTLTRQASRCWKFFESLKEDRILVITERPALYSVMDYGAVDFEAAKNDKSLLFELSRNLFRDIYVIQEIDLTTKKPTLATELWPTVEKESVLEFQNEPNLKVRISRVKHKDRY